MEVDTKKATSAVRLRSWKEVFQTRAESGLSVKEWCHDNDIPESRYYYWQKKLRRTAIEAACKEKFVEIHPDNFPTELSADRVLSPISNDAVMSIEVNGMHLNINGQVPEDVLATVLRVMRYA